MWPSTGLGPPTYRPFDFPYDEYRGGEFGSLAPVAAAATTASSSPWGPPTQTVVTTATTQHDTTAEDSVSL